MLQPVNLRYHAGPDQLTVLNKDHPGQVLLTVELHAKEQWIPADPTTTRTATPMMDTLQKVYEDAYYADARACRNELNNLLKGLSQENPSWRTLPDPPPELINSIDVLRSLVGHIEILAKTDPARALRLRQALAGAFGINPEMSAGVLTGT